MSSSREDAGSEPLLHQQGGSLMRVAPARLVVGRETSSSSNMRTAILVWLTLQNSIHTLLIRYSRAREVEEMFLSSVAVFMTEIVKTVICLLMVLYEERTPRKFIGALSAQVIKQPGDTLKVCVPAMIYIVQNNLFYVAASHLDAATFMITSQLKIFTAAIFSVLMLGRSLSRAQWVSLAILFLGVSLVQLQPGKSSKGDLSNQSPVIGFSAVVVACVLSGFAGIYFEKILKGAAPVSVWMRNVQMAVFSIPASLLAAYGQDGPFLSAHGMLYGFDSVVWITVFWYGIGGLSVAVCIKYADNIAKNFATSVAIILSTIGSVVVFGFIPSGLFVVGATLVILSIFLYSSSSSFLALLKRFNIAV